MEKSGSGVFNGSAPDCRPDNCVLKNSASGCDDAKFMRAAIKEAKRAVLTKDVPVGAVVVHDGRIIARGRNTKEKHLLSTRHAEINAIEKASKKLGAWRLEGCTLYVTLEPCPMCAGAIHQARLARVVYGARDRKHGALGTVFDLFAVNGLNHYPKVDGGVLESECSAMLSDFFRGLRSSRKRGEK